MYLNELQDKVTAYLNRSDLSAYITDFINLAQRRLEETDDWPWLEQVQSGSILESSPTISIPSALRKVKSLRVTADGYTYDCRQTSIDDLTLLPTSYGSTGRPRYFAIDWANNVIKFAPEPDRDYTYELRYIPYSDDLSESNNHNIWTDEHWNVLLYGALLEAQPFLLDDARLQIWLGIYQEAVRRLVFVKNSLEFSGYQNIRGGWQVI
jgi:hypothetical protein